MSLRIHHSDPRYALWLRIREILLDVLPEWFVKTFPANVRCSTIAEQIVEAIGPCDPPAAQLARISRRLARIEYRAARLVCYEPGAGMGSTLAEELRAELRRAFTECPFCGTSAGVVVTSKIVEALGEGFIHREGCEVLT